MSLIPSFFGGRRNNMFDLWRLRKGGFCRSAVQVAGECEGGGGEGCHGEWCSYCYCSQGRGQETRCQGYRYFWLRITYMHLNFYKNDETAGVGCFFVYYMIFLLDFCYVSVKLCIHFILSNIPIPSLSPATNFQKMSLIPNFLGGRRNNMFDMWDPFQDFPFTGGALSVPGETASFANTRIDWKETPEAHVFKADLPGVKKEEVKVEWHRVERSSGKFMRWFRLPENVKVEEVKAGMENGVLTVIVPKAEVKKPDVKVIDISG
ncbi:unnamed protein product, partial [Vitis vinifera]